MSTRSLPRILLLYTVNSQKTCSNFTSFNSNSLENHYYYHDTFHSHRPVYAPVVNEGIEKHDINKFLLLIERVFDCTLRNREDETYRIMIIPGAREICQ